MPQQAELPSIPLFDLRDSGFAAHVIAERARAAALQRECLSFLPRAALLALPAIDAITRRWLLRAQTPYKDEMAAVAQALATPGGWFLNGCYQWGCTTSAREQDGAPWLLRTLDWPFPGLGRYVEVQQLSGPCGAFFNVGWPGYVGALTAVAPGRFGAALNQAPLWRRTRQPWLRPYDMTRNAWRTWQTRHIPPDHLLRRVFETCQSFDEAQAMLQRTPIARPAIFTLVGCKRGERCVIERTQEKHRTHSAATGAANDWLERQPGWEARVGANVMFTRSHEETAANSRTRREHLAAWTPDVNGAAFGWVTPPVLNRYTRIAVELSPASGALRVVGYELKCAAPFDDSEDQLPVQVTNVFVR